jgi:hypothetical protein
VITKNYFITSCPKERDIEMFQSLLPIIAP